MASTEEGSLTLPDGTKLYTKTWKAQTQLKAHLIFVHGFSDHCNAYYNFFPSLASKGIQVHSFDQRGWGRSVTKASEKGLTGPTSQVLDDITAFTEGVLSSVSTQADAEAGKRPPIFMMGHSMGGQEVLCYLAQGPSAIVSQIRGFLFESPFVAVSPATKPFAITVKAGRLLSKILPNAQKVNVIDAKLLSRDSAVQKSFVDDKLCHDTGTLLGLAGMLDRAASLESGETRIVEGRGEGGRTRVWIGHGSADGVTDFFATKKLFEGLGGVGDREFREYEGWMHKLHAEPEPDCTTFANDVADWILARCGSLEELGDGPVKSRL